MYMMCVIFAFVCVWGGHGQLNTACWAVFPAALLSRYIIKVYMHLGGNMELTMIETSNNWNGDALKALSETEVFPAQNGDPLCLQV